MDIRDHGGIYGSGGQTSIFNNGVISVKMKSDVKKGDFLEPINLLAEKNTGAWGFSNVTVKKEEYTSSGFGSTINSYTPQFYVVMPNGKRVYIYQSSEYNSSNSKSRYIYMLAGDNSSDFFDPLPKLSETIYAGRVMSYRLIGENQILIFHNQDGYYSTGLVASLFTVNLDTMEVVLTDSLLIINGTNYYYSAEFISIGDSADNHGYLIANWGAAEFGYTNTSGSVWYRKFDIIDSKIVVGSDATFLESNAKSENIATVDAIFYTSIHEAIVRVNGKSYIFTKNGGNNLVVTQTSENTIETKNFDAKINKYKYFRMSYSYIDLITYSEDFLSTKTLRLLTTEYNSFGRLQLDSFVSARQRPRQTYFDDKPIFDRLLSHVGSNRVAATALYDTSDAPILVMNILELNASLTALKTHVYNIGKAYRLVKSDFNNVIYAILNIGYNKDNVLCMLVRSLHSTYTTAVRVPLTYDGEPLTKDIMERTYQKSQIGSSGEIIGVAFSNKKMFLRPDIETDLLSIEK